MQLLDTKVLKTRAWNFDTNDIKNINTIVCLGCSHTAGGHFAVTKKETWPKCLELILSNKDINIINLGTAGGGLFFAINAFYYFYNNFSKKTKIESVILQIPSYLRMPYPNIQEDIIQNYSWESSLYIARMINAKKLKLSEYIKTQIEVFYPKQISMLEDFIIYLLQHKIKPYLINLTYIDSSYYYKKMREYHNDILKICNKKNIKLLIANYDKYEKSSVNSKDCGHHLNFKGNMDFARDIYNSFFIESNLKKNTFFEIDNIKVGKKFDKI